eukprot:16299-Eustigmatos_ZCMA.PRE.1
MAGVTAWRFSYHTVSAELDGCTTSTACARHVVRTCLSHAWLSGGWRGPALCLPYAEQASDIGGDG